MEKYLKKTKDELVALARKAGVKGRSKMTKTQLAQALAEMSKVFEPVQAAVPASVPLHSEQFSVPARPSTPELPAYLGETRLCLMPQQPRIAFAYWELEEDHGVETFFRVRSVPDDSDVLLQAVEGRRGSFYVNLPRAGMEIESDLGIRVSDVFVSLVTSNRIRLPEDAPSEDVDTLWMTRHKDYEEIFRLSGGSLEDELRYIAYGRRGPGAPVSSWPSGEGKGRP